MDEMQTMAVVPWIPARNVVVQHNALAEAKYRLTVRAQKLLIRLLAELDQKKENFTEIKLYLRDFAKLAHGDPSDVLFTEFVDTAKQFMGQFVSITQSPVLGEKLSRSLICHWISSIEKNPNEKSITFSFDSKLRPYLLGLSKNYFHFQTLHAFNLDSIYSIRLYQWAKSREFLRRPQKVTVGNLRQFLGTMELDADGATVKESLKRYNDFKKVALAPAVKEISKKTDLHLSFQEVKQPGTKTICAIIFAINSKEGAGSSFLEDAFRTQIELPLEATAIPKSVEPEPNILGYIKETYRLTVEQVAKVQSYIDSNGMGYVLDKIEISESQPRDNIARFFLAALRGDYQLPVRHTPVAKKAKIKPELDVVAPPLSGEETLQAVQIGVETLRAWRRTLAGGLG